MYNESRRSTWCRNATAWTKRWSFWGKASEKVFEEQLDGWYRAPEVWPAKRDLTTFQSWFEVTFHWMIVDLAEDVLEHEEL
jgi:hypothetical protein